MISYNQIINEFNIFDLLFGTNVEKAAKTKIPGVNPADFRELNSLRQALKNKSLTPDQRLELQNRIKSVQVRIKRQINAARQKAAEVRQEAEKAQANIKAVEDMGHDIKQGVQKFGQKVSQGAHNLIEKAKEWLNRKPQPQPQPEDTGVMSQVRKGVQKIGKAMEDHPLAAGVAGALTAGAGMLAARKLWKKKQQPKPTT